MGPFDPVLHGWRDRGFVVGENAGIVTSNGVFRPIALVDGRAVATWSLSGDRLVLRPLQPIGVAELEALRQDANAVADYLARPSFTVSVDG